MTRRSILGWLSSIPFLGFAKPLDKQQVLLYVNGVEIPYDNKKLLKIEFRANVDDAETGPISIEISGKRITVKGNDEQNSGLFLSAEHAEMLTFYGVENPLGVL